APSHSLSIISVQYLFYPLKSRCNTRTSVEYFQHRNPSGGGPEFYRILKPSVPPPEGFGVVERCISSILYRRSSALSAQRLGISDWELSVRMPNRQSPIPNPW